MNIKKMIIILLVILLLLAIVLFSIILIGIKHKSDLSLGDIEEVIEENYSNILVNVDNRSNYSNIKTIVERVYFELEINDSENMYNMLNEKYIKSENITIENALNFNEFELNGENYSTSFYDIFLTEVLISEVDYQRDMYIVKGNVIMRYEEQAYPFALLINIDKTNSTFSIYPETEEFKFSEYTVGDNLNIQMEDSIEFKTSNKYFFEIIEEETYVVSMFDEYMNLILRNKEKSYEYLDVNYSKLRFNDLEEYTEYVTDNYKTFYLAELYQYQIDVYDDYTQYTFIDERDNTYIFKETTVMQYSVILDIYTVDIPQISEQYNISSDSDKVLINIQKIFNALNFKDYEYVYSKLDNTFKTTNFNTLEKFKIYIEENLFSIMEIYYGSYEINSDIIMYDITIKNKDNTNDMGVSKTFVMQLDDNGNFVMSFNI